MPCEPWGRLAERIPRQRGYGPSSCPAARGASPRSPHPSSQPPLHPHLSVSVPLLSLPLSFSPPSAPIPACAHQHLPRLGFCTVSAGLHLIALRWPQGPVPRWPDLVSHPSPEQEGELPPGLPAQPLAKPGPPACGQHAENGEYPYWPGSRGGGATLTGWEAVLRPGAVAQERREGRPPLAHGGPAVPAHGESLSSLLPERQPSGFACIPSRCPGDQKTGMEWGPLLRESGGHKGVPAGREARWGGKGSPLGGGGGLVCDFSSSLSRRPGVAPSPGPGRGCRVSQHSLGAAGSQVSPWGPPVRPAAAPAHVTVQGARGDQRGAGQVPHGCFPQTPPRRRGCGDLEHWGSVSQEVGAGRAGAGVASPLSRLCMCSAPPRGPGPGSDSHTRSPSAWDEGASGQALHFPRPLCLRLRKEHLIKNASGAPPLSLCHTHSSAPGHPREAEALKGPVQPPSAVKSQPPSAGVRA